MSHPSSFWSELKRRNVVRVGTAYAVMAWLLTEVSDTLFPNLGLPQWTVTLVIALLLIGLPLALFLAWAYELTPEGIKKSAEVHPRESITHFMGRRLDFVIIGVLALALGWFVWDKFGASVQRGAASQLEPSIAVLPFTDMSPAGDQAYFADGLSEEILNLLAGIRELKVTGRTSSFSFKGKDVPIPEIGRALGVAHVLEGSVRKAGDRLRITAQLIKADDGFHLWSDSYDRQLEDVFAIQDEIAGAIARSLEVTLTGQAVTGDLAAYDLYLQARTLIHRRTVSGLKQARQLIDQALRLDPDYAPALAASAELWLLLADSPDSYGEVPPDQAYPAARAQLQRALALNPELADAHAAMGLLFQILGDYGGAHAHLARALEINPSLTNANHWQALALSRAGRAREAVTAGQRLAELDPLFLTNLTGLVGYYLTVADYTAADQLAQRLQRSYSDRSQTLWILALSHWAQGRLAAAAEAIERAVAMDAEWVHTGGTAALIHYSLGDFEKARQRAPEGTDGWLLIAQDQTDAALAQVRARSAAAPANPDATTDLFSALSWAGRHQELLDEVAGRWGSVAGLRAEFQTQQWTYMLELLGTAQRATGREAELVATLAEWGELLAFLADNGQADTRFLVNQASYQALGGHREAALAALADAIDGGWRDPLLARQPVFEPWQDDLAFASQVARMTELINAERAKLDMKPLP